MSPRHRPPDPWPWPADNPLERARRVAGFYRDALSTADADQCKVLDARMTEIGQTWATGQRKHHDADDLLTLVEVADYYHVQPSTVDRWRSRGLVATATPDGPRYRLADLIEYHRARRLRRVT